MHGRARRVVPVDVALAVNVADGMHQLAEERAHVALAQCAAHQIEQLAAPCILHHLQRRGLASVLCVKGRKHTGAAPYQVYFGLGHDDLVQLDDVPVPQVPPNLHLPLDHGCIHFLHGLDRDLCRARMGA
jgi:hypothetical protein